MIQTMALAFSLSLDGFAAAVAKGASYPDLSAGHRARIALGFGAAEALAPIAGFLLGAHFAAGLAAVDHWIAFGLLSALGLRLIWRSRAPADVAAPGRGPSLAAAACAAIGASVDGAVVGVTLALTGQEIWGMAAAIGLISAAMALAGLRFGGILGARVGRRAEAAGGLGLIAVGTHILFTHLAGAG